MARNPYEELASPDAPAPPPSAAPNPYDALAADPDPAEGPAPAPHSGSADDGPLGFTLRSDYDEREYEDRMPYLRAVRRRRRSRIRTSLKIGIALAVLLAFLGVGDRWAVLYAENKAAEKVQGALKLHAEPEVHINGFPFLTQLASERLDDVDITIPDMPAGRVSVAQVKGSVNDVRIVGDAPTSIKGAVLGQMRGHVLLDFDDLDRELGTSQVRFTAGGKNTVMADGKLPVAGTEVKVRARAHLERTSDHGIGTTVDDMRLEVPKLFSYTPGERGGLQLSRPLAKRIQHDAAKAKALFGVGSIAKRFGLTPERAAQVRQSEDKLHEVTGTPKFVDKMMKVNMLDVLMEHPELLKKIGIDPSLIEGLKKIEEPKLADKLSLSQKLPDMPGDVRLTGISVAKDGIRADLEGVDVPFGETAKK
ncbi:LmeA family phospholipid-binding protein [Streptomyces daliensis]